MTSDEFTCHLNSDGCYNVSINGQLMFLLRPEEMTEWCIEFKNCRDNNIPLDGACGGCQSCSTCHVYVNTTYLDKIKPAEEKEEDILDMVDDLKDNSRLACAIKITKDLEGMILELPELITNLED